MSQKLSPDTQKQRAIMALEQSRYEMSSDFKWARRQLSPTNIVHNAVEKHPKALVITALVAGFLVPRILFRRRQPQHIIVPAPSSLAKAPHNTTLETVEKRSKTAAVAAFVGAALWKVLKGPLMGLAAQKLTPLLLEYIHRPHPGVQPMVEEEEYLEHEHAAPRRY